MQKITTEESKKDQETIVTKQNIKEDVKLASNFYTLNEKYFA